MLSVDLQLLYINTVFVVMDVISTPENPLCLNRFTGCDHYAVFVMEMGSDAMNQAGILEGDILVIDRRLDPQEGDIVVANYGPDYCCGRLYLNPMRFVPESSNPFHVTRTPVEGDWVDKSPAIFGVVTHAVSKVRGVKRWVPGLGGE